jgi:hypothetical protein
MYDSKTYKLTSKGKKFFGTKKNTVRVVAMGADGKVTLSGGYWDGGSREEYSTLTKNGRMGMVNYPTTPREFGGGDAPTVALTDGIAIVKGGVFLGKVAGLTLYVTSHDGWVTDDLGIEVVR